MNILNSLSPASNCACPIVLDLDEAISRLDALRAVNADVNSKDIFAAQNAFKAAVAAKFVAASAAA